MTQHERRSYEETAGRSYRINKIMLHLMVFSSILLTYLGYALFWPIDILEPQKQPYKAVTKTVKQGENFRYIVDTCKKRDAVASIVRIIVVDGVEYRLTPEQGTVRKGCNKVEVTVPIPDTIPVGKASMIIYITYPLNPFRNLYYNLEVEEFYITRGAVKK